jgi:GGDEF domain-containing protein
VAIALLVYDHLNHRVTELVFWLTLGLIVAVFVRMIETLRRQSRALRSHERDAFADPATGLDNRRKLEADLAWVTASGGRWTMLLVELDGLQAYNDRFGYSTGDKLLRRTALGLRDAVAPLEGGAYRVDAARFAVLAPCGAHGSGELVLAATAPPREGETVLGRSYGEVAIPGEATDPAAALRIGGQRLDAHRQRQQRSARRQAHAVLMAALSARRPELRDHLRGIAYDAISLGRRLGAGVTEIDDIALAAELQEVGLLAVPESVLERGRAARRDGDGGDPRPYRRGRANRRRGAGAGERRRAGPRQLGALRRERLPRWPGRGGDPARRAGDRRLRRLRGDDGGAAVQRGDEPRRGAGRAAPLRRRPVRPARRRGARGGAGGAALRRARPSLRRVLFGFFDSPLGFFLALFDAPLRFLLCPLDRLLALGGFLFGLLEALFDFPLALFDPLLGFFEALFDAFLRFAAAAAVVAAAAAAPGDTGAGDRQRRQQRRDAAPALRSRGFL